MGSEALTLTDEKATPQKSMRRICSLFRKGRFLEAKQHCELAYSRGVRSFEFLHVYGLVLRACREFERALEIIFAAHEQVPTDAKILNSLGLAFLDLDEVETAIEVFKRATSADQTCFNAWDNLGNALRSAERYQAAELAFVCAHHAAPAKLEPLFNIALLQTDLRQFRRAAELIDQLLENNRATLARNKKLAASLRLRRLQVAIKLEDLDYVEQHQALVERQALSEDEQVDLDRALAQYNEVCDRLEEAIAILEKAALRKGSRRADLAAHLGFYYGLAGRIGDGIATLEALLSEFPDHDGARYNLSLLQFKAGEIAEGFENYETRWRFRAFPSMRRTFDAPLWQGEPLEGKNILVWREQGIGDEVRFASLLPELAEWGAAFTFECTPKLMPLFKASFPGAVVRPEGEALCVEDPEYDRFDYQIPVGSLGRVLRRTLTDFQEKQRPWLHRNLPVEEQVRRQLALKQDELLVGLCWRSMNQVASRDKVFLHCEQLAGFKGLPSVRWLNLQYGSTDDEIRTIRARGVDIHDYTDVDQKDDLIGACGLIGACDLVISVGGSVGDLAGGLGAPMIYMTREHSEAFLGTDHVPWFVNCKSYPIAAYKSDETIARIVQDWPELRRWAESLRPEERKISGETSAQAAPLDLRLQYVDEAAA